MNEEIDKNLSLKISGKAMDFNDGFELNYLTDTLENTQNLIEKTYLFTVGKTRMNQEDREHLKIIMKNPSKGSFNADIDIQLFGVALTLIPLISKNGAGIWSAIKNTYEFLKLVIDSKKKEKPIEINNTGEGTVIVNINNGNENENHIQKFPEYVEGLSEKLSPEFEKITRNIDGEKIKTINFSDMTSGENLSLDYTDRQRFETTSSISDDLFNLKGQIVIANSNSYTGKIQIYKNKYDIEPGEYSFSVAKRFENKNFFKSKYLIDEKYQCQIKLSTDFSKGVKSSIAGINIVSVVENGMK